jgi:hypothetical protein
MAKLMRYIFLLNFLLTSFICLIIFRQFFPVFPIGPGINAPGLFFEFLPKGGDSIDLFND